MNASATVLSASRILLPSLVVKCKYKFVFYYLFLTCSDTSSVRVILEIICKTITLYDFTRCSHFSAAQDAVWTPICAENRARSLEGKDVWASALG